MLNYCCLAEHRLTILLVIEATKVDYHIGLNKISCSSSYHVKESKCYIFYATPHFDREHVLLQCLVLELFTPERVIYCCNTWPDPSGGGVEKLYMFCYALIENMFCCNNAWTIYSIRTF